MYKVKIVVESVEINQGKIRNVPVLTYDYVSHGPDGKERFFGRHRAMIEGMDFLFTF